jgi:hypothetical protein
VQMNGIRHGHHGEWEKDGGHPGRVSSIFLSEEAGL